MICMSSLYRCCSKMSLNKGWDSQIDSWKKVPSGVLSMRVHRHFMHACVHVISSSRWRFDGKWKAVCCHSTPYNVIACVYVTWCPFFLPSVNIHLAHTQAHMSLLLHMPAQYLVQLLNYSPPCAPPSLLHGNTST